MTAGPGCADLGRALRALWHVDTSRLSHNPMPALLAASDIAPRRTFLGFCTACRACRSQPQRSIVRAGSKWHCSLVVRCWNVGQNLQSVCRSQPGKGTERAGSNWHCTLASLASL